MSSSLKKDGVYSFNYEGARITGILKQETDLKLTFIVNVDGEWVDFEIAPLNFYKSNPILK